MARIGLVVDAACDLPQSFIAEHGIEMLPIKLSLGDQEWVDKRDPARTQELLTSLAGARDVVAETRPLGVQEVKELFLERLALRYDKVLVICMSQTRERVFDNASNASFSILQEYRRVRAEAGLTGVFTLRVMDSQTLFSGEALLAHEAASLIREQISFEKLRQSVEELSGQVRTLLVSDDLDYLRHRDKRTYDHSVDFITYQLGKAVDIKPVISIHRGASRAVARPIGFSRALEAVFDQIREAVVSGLRKPLVAMSFAGDPIVIRQSPEYQRFIEFANENHIEVMLAVMSVSGAIHAGPGAFSAAFV